MRRRTGVRLIALSGVLALAVTACGGSSTGGSTKSDGKKGDSAKSGGALDFSIDDEAKGPAPEVKGATKGGTVKIIELDDVTHLDPARIYVNYYQTISSVITRQLNTYRQTADGKVTLVGDLATSTGKTDDGGKTWTWTLRDNIKWSDGEAITADQIKYGIERTFAAAYTEGPTYVNEWLVGNTDFRKVYAGPYTGKHLDNVQAVDAKTLKITFDKPRPDVKFAAALPNFAPVRPAKDTKDKYDIKPDASGPYMIESHVVDKSLTLVKNPNWDPNSDPARYQFVDKYAFEFGVEPLPTNQRLIAANGEDANAMTLVSNVSPEVLQQVDTTPELKARTLNGFTQFVRQININNTRVTDVEIRKALLLAYPRFQARQIVGGASYGEFANTVLSPSVPGYHDFNIFNAKPEGDPVAAMEILKKAGKVNMPIVYGFPNTSRGQQVSVAVAAGLTKAGFKVIKKPIDSKTYYDVIGDVKNGYDLYAGGWGADWPSASTVIPPTLDGRKIGTGLPNYEHFNDPEVNAEIDRISAMTDLEKAGVEWGKLDEKIMSKVPYIPYVYDKANQLYGPNIGGVYLDKVLGEPNLNGIYLKKS